MQKKESLMKYWEAVDALINAMKKQYPVEKHKSDSGYIQAITNLQIACVEGKKLESYGMLGALGLKGSVDKIEDAVNTIGEIDTNAKVAVIKITGQASCALAEQFVNFIPSVYEFHEPKADSSGLLKSGWAGKLNEKLTAAKFKVSATCERIKNFKTANPDVGTQLEGYKNPYPTPAGEPKAAPRP